MVNLKLQTEKMKNDWSGKGSGNESNPVQIMHHSFHSLSSFHPVRKGTLEGDLYYHEMVDRKIPENEHFTYPVILPAGNRKYSGGILLLHGLNEKSWEKYLAWGSELAERLQCPVILFPIAYHMNRAPRSWSDPRQMKEVVHSRLKTSAKSEATFANAALSTRLAAHPEQFIYSGIQSYYDVCALYDEISKGDHPLFEPNSRIDFFAYSIGAFLAQILLIANPGHRFDHSRLFLFAGGPTFDRMMGTSRYIMDFQAFKSLLTLKRRKILKKLYATLVEAELPEFEAMWRGFYAMLHHRKGRKYRQAWLKTNSELIQVVALKKDRVMPAGAIVHTFKTPRNIEPVRIDVIDFPFDYSHENPFPLNDDKIQALVNRSFEIMIDKAVRFYQQTVSPKAAVQYAKGFRHVQLLPA